MEEEKELQDQEKEEEINFKERFGTIPKSIMKFKKSQELMDLIDWDNSDLGKIEGKAKPRGGGYAKNLRYSIYNPDQATFIIDYYTKPNSIILDPFMGRATRPLISLYLGRKYIGFDTSTETVELNKRLIESKFPNSKYKLYHSDGTEMVELKNKSDACDAIFTCPPYYDSEVYSGEPGDLSYMTIESFNTKIVQLFYNCYRLLKPSSYERLDFNPMIVTVGSIRRGENGLIDMDCLFQNVASNMGFTLHDKLLTENISPGVGFTFRRNHKYSYVAKNYETTLVFVKYQNF